MHLVFRLGESQLRLFRDELDHSGILVDRVLIGGARAGYYVREVPGPQLSVGVQLRPGAAEALFGAPSDAFTGRHTPLVDLWGPAVSSMRGRLAEQQSLADRLDTLEALLVARVRRARALHPAVARALRQFTVTADVGLVVRESGYSHRTFISQFRRSVGLTPKEYTRVVRLQRAIKQLVHTGSLAELAAGAGYSDQAHLSREFRTFSGVTPREYRRLAPQRPHHLVPERTDG